MPACVLTAALERRGPPFGTIREPDSQDRERDFHTALMHQPFSGVQASGEISVHVLVHAHFDISPGRPFAPSGRSRAYTHALRTRCPHEPRLTRWRERGGDTLAPVRDYL